VLELENGDDRLDLDQLVIDLPVAARADLSELGIEELDRGVCEDSFQNRAILRRSKLIWETVYTQDGSSSGLIKVRSAESTRERRIQSLSEKRPILVNPGDNNSDYLTGLDLIAEEATDYLVPPWVMGATRKWLKEQDNGGPASAKRQPVPLPHRCRHVKHDGIRCMLWGSGRPQDDGLCRIHLRSVKSKTSDDIERAREKLMQAAPYAVDKLEELMEFAESEPVKLKAATEILDRAGVRGGVEIDTTVNVDVRPAAQIIAERLERLTLGAATAARLLTDDGVDVVDAEVVVEEPRAAATAAVTGSETFNEESKEAAGSEERPSIANTQEEK
jgi:hypothetical protein